MSYGSGTIEQYALKSGKTLWSIRYMAAGKQVRERGFSSQADAKKALRQRITAIEEGRYVQPSSETLASFTEGWLERQATRLKPSTHSSYARNLRDHVLPDLGSRALQKIDGVALDTLYARLLSSGKKDHEEGSGLSPTTVRYIHTIIGAVLGDAMKRGLIQRNPAQATTPPRKADRGSHVTWTRDQVKTFLTATRGDVLYPVWRTLLFTGMRRGEALGLAWDQVDLDEGTITVNRSLVDVDWGKPVFSTPKTASGRRTLDLDEDTVEILRQLRQSQVKERLMQGPAYKDHRLVFCHVDGAPHHPDRLSKQFQQAVARTGLPRVRLHDLRHAHATMLLLAGVPAHVVQRRLGHAHVSITLGIYASVLPNQDRDAADRFAQVIA